MLRLAIGGHDQFLVSTLEIDRGGVSYTVDTLQAIRAEHPGNELFLLLGADTLHDLPHWREPAAILELATPVVVQRPGSPTPDFSVLEKLVSSDRRATFRQHAVEMPLIALSSTDLRARASQGHSLRYRTPRAVEKYIESQRLYRTA
jgi:nicotinate-nucleotide adenylyltransferase